MSSSLANSPSRQGDIGAVFRSLSQRGVGLHDIVPPLRPHADTILGWIWVRRGFSAGKMILGKRKSWGAAKESRCFSLFFLSIKKDVLFHPFPEKEDR